MSEFKYMGHKMPYLPDQGRTGKLIVVEGTDGVGRSTQLRMLKDWLEVQGYAVLETGWTRSKLIGQAITDAKAGHSLHRLTYCLLYASDLADRLEFQIIPALKSGFIVLADRYIYTMIARGLARGAEKDWLKDLYSFAITPDVVFYLQIQVQELIQRTLAAGGLNYWESGMDMNYGDDIYDSFVAYQSELTSQLDAMASEERFRTVHASDDAGRTQKELRRLVAEYLKDSPALPRTAAVDAL